MAVHAAHGGIVRYRFASLFVLLLLASCDGPAMPADGGGLDATTTPDGGGGDSGPVCTSASDCDDGLYCNGTETCAPGTSGAAANGCVAGTSPCSAGEMCDETSTSCISADCPSDPSMRDADNDGHQTMACPGGDDCDDSDPNRYPGNTEVCNGGGDPLDTHDEDCDSSTVGNLDADGDTYVSAVCCNGDTCGPDCDDSNAAVHPGVAESCNGLDDDCDGSVDNSSGSLCPGGLCSAGHCALNAWDRVFGGDSGDRGQSVAMDTTGNVVVGGYVNGVGVDYGGSGGPVDTMDKDGFVVSYGPDGAFRWRTAVFDLPGNQQVVDVGITDGGIVYALLYIDTLSSPHDFGSGSRSQSDMLLFALDGSDGSYMWDRVVQPKSLGIRLAVVAEDVVAVGGSYGTAYATRIGSDGSEVWSQTYTSAADGIRDFVGKPAVRADGLLVGAHDASGAAFIGELDLTSGTVRSTSVPIPGVNIEQVAVATGGDFYVAGSFAGTVSLGHTCEPSCASQGSFDGIIVAVVSDSISWVRTFGDSLVDKAHGVAVRSSGNIVVAGQFEGQVNFGGGARRSCSSPPGTVCTISAGTIASYTSAGSYLWDNTFGNQFSASDAYSSANAVVVGVADSTAITGGFTGTVDFGSGERISANAAATVPLSDAFVARLAN